jgi:SAM-dependent methyltransferase
MKRIVQPELLDALPAGDSLARRSRNDLLRVNGWMGNAATLARQLQAVTPTPKSRRLLDLGAGDGRFMWQVAKRLPSDWQGTVVDLLDKQAAVSPQARLGLEDLGWQVRELRADVNQSLDRAPTEPWSAICANLFLHHFAEKDLQQLLKLISQRTREFVAVEPRRSLWGLLASRMVGLIGCNRVTRHDAVISVRAGFRGKDLSDLWPKHGGWVLQERAAGIFGHLFVARAMESAFAPSASSSPFLSTEGRSKGSLARPNSHGS